jgi:hypothetical protein
MLIWPPALFIFFITDYHPPKTGGNWFQRVQWTNPLVLAAIAMIALFIVLIVFAVRAIPAKKRVVLPVGPSEKPTIAVQHYRLSSELPHAGLGTAGAGRIPSLKRNRRKGFLTIELVNILLPVLLVIYSLIHLFVH